LVNFDSVRVQVGRAPRDTDERHYVDMVDAKLSSQAVWDVLTGARLFTGEFGKRSIIRIFQFRLEILILCRGGESAWAVMQGSNVSGSGGSMWGLGRRAG